MMMLDSGGTLLPLAFAIEGFAVANNYAGNPDPTSQGHASEAMSEAGFGVILGVIVLIGCTIVAGIIAREARLNVLVATLGGAISHGADRHPGQLAARSTGRWGLAGLDGRGSGGTITATSFS